MFNNATSPQGWPKYISSDNDPLFQYHRWKANLHALDDGAIPVNSRSGKVADINIYRWKKHCRGLFQLQEAA